jgi:hypothetical protein
MQKSAVSESFQAMSEESKILRRIQGYAAEWRMDEGRSETDYQWVVDYADKQSERSTRTVEYLDSKADAMTRYIGLLITLGVLVVSYAVSRDAPREDILFFAPALAALLYSLGNALRCTKPEDQPRPPLIGHAFAYSQHPDNNRLYFTRSLIELEYKLWLLNQRKGTLIEFSLKGFFLALAWLLIGVIGLLYKGEITYFLSFQSELAAVAAGLFSVVGLALWQYLRPVAHGDWGKAFAEQVND